FVVLAVWLAPATRDRWLREVSVYVEGVLQDAIFCPAVCGPHSSSRTHINSVEDAVRRQCVRIGKDSKMGLRRGVMARRSVWVALVLFCFCFNLCTYTASGQAVFGSIIGTVTDAQGNAVSGAKVTVTSISKSTAFETISNDSGNFAVTHLIPDDYRVQVEAAGFKGYSVERVTVTADSSITL